MKPNLAAAVELVAKWRRESSKWKADKRKQLIPSHFDLGRIKALDQCAAELKTILAELGRGAGEPVAEVVKPPNGFGVKFMDGFENLPSGTKLYTRPPVAGLAELTDVKLVALYSELRHTSKEFCGLPHPMENWAEAHDAAIAKAAREFLGKVDG